jgi:hypothetical protein
MKTTRTHSHIIDGAPAHCLGVINAADRFGAAAAICVTIPKANSRHADRQCPLYLVDQYGHVAIGHADECCASMDEAVLDEFYIQPVLKFVKWIDQTEEMLAAISVGVARAVEDIQ